MAISQESKQALAKEIDALREKKSSLTRRIQELGDKKDILVAMRTEINSQINKLQADSI